MQPRLPAVKLSPRYHVVDEIARGGMGVVLLALRTEAKGASPVAIKQLHAHLVDNPEVVGSFVDEARIASRILHPNVVHVLDVEMVGEQLVIVMDYVEGIPLRELLRGRESGLPLPIVRRILVDVLHGLHAAHELRDDAGEPLGIVHRDVSPHNLLVGANGVTRVTDFGIAMAAGRIATTKPDGAVKGKLQYLSPEQVFRKGIDRRTDVFAAGIVGWEMLAGRKLFEAGTEGETLAMILREPIAPPSAYRLDVPLDLDESILRALEREPDRRFATAAEFARAIEEGGPLASREEVEALVVAEIGETLAARRQRLAAAVSSPPVPATIEEEDEEAPTRVAASSTPTFVLRARPLPSVSPIALLVVGCVCVSGGLLAGFSVRATSSGTAPAGSEVAQAPSAPPEPIADPASAAPSPPSGTVIGASPMPVLPAAATV